MVAIALSGGGTFVHILVKLTRTGASPPWVRAHSRQTHAAYGDW
ncbi:hypothetical protein [Nannocystis pusilla]